MKRWVIFPSLSHAAKQKLFLREAQLAQELSDYRYNTVRGDGKLGVICGGVSAAYVRDALAELGVPCRVMTVATPYPFPEKLALSFVQRLEAVLCLEELDPVLEDALIALRGKTGFAAKVLGKRTGDTIIAGENSHAIVKRQLEAFFGLAPSQTPALEPDAPALAVRPPILCAGCPHRASFYAVKQAMKGQKAVFSGDIGCYTLGNAAPLLMTDTCLCMGAGITIAQGMARAGDDAVHIGFVGDSTFFHSGVTNLINAVYNQTDILVVILDNATTAMTGHQPHPGIGKTMMGAVGEKISIEKLVQAIGVASLRVVNPLDLEQSVQAVAQAAQEKGVRVIIMRAPCVAIVKPKKALVVSDACRKCQKCIRELGCPALSLQDGKAQIEPGLCTGCGLCSQVCPFDAIGEERA